MTDTRRLVLFDPGLDSGIGHHADLNAQLLPALQAAGWCVELWADARAGDDPQLAAQLPGLRPLLRNAGYIDPRHWCDLSGSLHQAALLRPQLQAALAGAPVQVWLAHSLLPFQLIALAQLLQQQPPARVLISLMFPPEEVFAGQPGFDLQAQRQAVLPTTRTALAALALAVQRAGHQLLLGAASEQLIASYAPLCAAVGLPPPRLHPAPVVGGALAGGGSQAASLLLHWGERKPDKGRELALALLAALLDGVPLPPPLQSQRWLFHASGREPPPPAEVALLQRAAADPRIRLLEGTIPRPQMLAELAACELALLPYCPRAYAGRSSGVLWLYGAARLAREQPARVLGRSGGWLAAEAPALGLSWQSLPEPLLQPPDASALLAAMAATLHAPAPQPWITPYGREVLGGDWRTWLVERLNADRMS